CRIIYSSWIGREFNNVGENTRIGFGMTLLNGQCITLGSNTIIGRRVVLTAWNKFNGENFNPIITIGNGCGIGDDSHITCINRIEIGNGVLTGKKITITDNAHGVSDFDSLEIAPIRRPLFSKGAVVIEDNVW